MIPTVTSRGHFIVLVLHEWFACRITSGGPRVGTSSLSSGQITITLNLPHLLSTRAHEQDQATSGTGRDLGGTAYFSSDHLSSGQTITSIQHRARAQLTIHGIVKKRNPCTNQQHDSDRSRFSGFGTCQKWSLLLIHPFPQSLDFPKRGKALVSTTPWPVGESMKNEREYPQLHEEHEVQTLTERIEKMEASQEAASEAETKRTLRMRENSRHLGV